MKKNNNNNNNQINLNDIEIKNLTFSEIIKINFLELHPICTLFHSSKISPIIFNLWIFVYNFLLYFGWNALYYSETKIEKRIFRENRNNFIYPIKYEFDKILLSLITTMFCCLIVRLIVLVSKDKYQLLNNIDKENNDKKIKIENEIIIKRLIAIILIIVFIFFFFYYCIVFCSIYKNTQESLMFSGIWTNFFVWIIFAPILIIVISIIEFKVNREIIYYLKRLFIF